ncbi:hypothetical protein [Cesiribacter andamanensis]|uniref:DUF3575 domain-containing protein n=1 Tax=Cesiribacter andamanensis AMV16 TaxID=1279009 RepID=M7NRJ5_9BACT|nr:hypothetical protein [Cesiribacter andamanensis]EMR01129.1 hypothetical protein ADICEAN_03751 [Cesiribacter andamanensis AMV16]
MMNTCRRIVVLLFSLVCVQMLAACSSLSESAKFELNEGYYKEKRLGADRQVYVYASEDTLVAFPVQKRGEQLAVDTAAATALAFPAVASGQGLPAQTYHAYSFDLDVLAIPFKYRPTTVGHPRQLGTQFSGALYAGYRTDRYRIRYRHTPLGIAHRRITHYGYSIGLFSGIGAEPINPWVTRNRYADEYDGVVWMNGLAAIIGINSFTFGLAIGADRLLDRNRSIWIYQNRPWLGLAVGLNLN